MSRKKTYIIYYEWANTAGNHAGMAYLFRTLKELNKKNICLIKIPTHINDWNRKFQKLYTYLLILFLYVKANKKDNVFFTEFLGNKSGNQTFIANKLKQWKIKANLLGLVHLSEKHLLELYNNDDYIRYSLSLLDKVIVLGSSLGKYFNRLGFNDDKVIVTFHYVDTNYYKPNLQKQKNEQLRVIAMGSLKRNHNDLRIIIEATPNIQYDVCMGNANLKSIFDRLDNVTLHGFLSECELLHLMQQVDVSISVLDDTIGSNVITTSLACGLVQVVSDVGSIRDYCDETNSFLCNTNEDFIKALNTISLNEKLRLNMSISTQDKAKEIDIKQFNLFFRQLIK